MGKNGLGGIKTKGKKKYVNPNEKKFTLQIEKTAEGDEYYPCVNLCSTGDSVEIITQWFKQYINMNINWD